MNIFNFRCHGLDFSQLVILTPTWWNALPVDWNLKNGHQMTILCILFELHLFYPTNTFSTTLSNFARVPVYIAWLKLSDFCSAVHRERAAECPYVLLQTGASDDLPKSNARLVGKSTAWRTVEQLSVEKLAQLVLDIRAFTLVCGTMLFDFWGWHQSPGF